MSRVRIGTCSDPADAAFLRSMFGARGIAVVIGAEHHASLLGPLGGGFLSLDIWVDAEDAEDAAALLHDLREGGTDDDGADDADTEHDQTDGASEADPASSAATAATRGEPHGTAEPPAAIARSGEPRRRARHGEPSATPGADSRALVAHDHDDDGDDGEPVDAWLKRRRRTVIAVVSGAFITFGTAHMLTGAWKRGLAIAAVQAAGLAAILTSHAAGGLVIPIAILSDLIGALWHARMKPPPRLPRAIARQV